MTIKEFARTNIIQQIINERCEASDFGDGCIEYSFSGDIDAETIARIKDAKASAGFNGDSAFDESNGFEEAFEIAIKDNHIEFFYSITNNSF